MAYPFTKFPSLDEFIGRATSPEYHAKTGSVKMTGPRGKVEIRVLIRKLQKTKKLAVIPDIKGDDILTPHVLRSLCVQLDIPPSDFGLTLD
jgi:hypothetical protein